jgi:preprotein translocase subunit YajC
MGELFSITLYLQEPGQGGPGILVSLLPIVLMLLVFYFLVMRPHRREQERRERETAEFLSSLKTGDKVVTNGGIFGTITSLRDETVQLKIADAVKIEILRSAIARRQAEGAPAQESKS